MNIFFLDTDPVKAAQQMPDNYTGKMALEAAQILSTSIRYKLGSPGQLIQTYTTPIGKSKGVRPYPYTLESDTPENPIIYLAYNANNPLALWIRYSKQNFNWLVKHAKALCKEFKARGSKDGSDHESLKIIELCEEMASNIESWQYKQLTPFPMVVGTIIDDDPVKSYRAHLHKKSCSWKDGAPDWWNSDLNEKLKPKKKEKN